MGRNFKFQVQDSFFEYFFLEIWKMNSTFWKKATFIHRQVWPIFDPSKKCRRLKWMLPNKKLYIHLILPKEFKLFLSPDHQKVICRCTFLWNRFDSFIHDSQRWLFRKYWITRRFCKTMFWNTLGIFTFGFWHWPIWSRKQCHQQVNMTLVVEFSLQSFFHSTILRWRKLVSISNGVL